MENKNEQQNMPTPTPTEQPTKPAPPKVSAFEKSQKKQKNTSIFFLLWAVISVLSLLICVLFGVTQQVMMTQSYKNAASRELTEKGGRIKEEVLKGSSASFGGNYSGYLRFLSRSYDVEIFILDEKGEVLFPEEPNLDLEAPEIEAQFSFPEEVQTLKEKLAESEGEAVIYEATKKYVYGAKISLYEDVPLYLYVTKSLGLLENAQAYMTMRMALVAVFMTILAFAVSSAVSGWLTKPISEITEKAKQLAEGDFNVDFHGSDYGQEMVELADTLNFARDELSKTDRMQKELIANVSHDFKTPLTMIKAYASMIIEISGGDPAKRNKHAQVIVDEADRLASLVNDILDISKVRAGLEEFRMESFDMSAYLGEVLERFSYLKEAQYGYEIQTEIEKGLITCADKLKIGQVLYNLIGNAVNYTGEDKKVFVRLKKQTDGNFRFSVTDTGAGIKPEELNGIWDRYYRSNEMHKRPVQGTGLGLSIVKTVLERHRLPFGVESEMGKGSTFYVDFLSQPNTNA